MTNTIEPAAMFKLSYGLFVLTAREGDSDNGCIINTCVQLTDNPKRVAIGVNKGNYTHDLIKRTGLFNLNVLSTDTPFKVFQHFGFQSGRNVNKFADCESEKRSANGLLYLGKYANAFISARVEQTVDCDSHSLFIAAVTEAAVLLPTPSATYEYYFANIKPKPAPKPQAKKGWVCKICGYVYEGEVLPPDFICPICKHGAADFEPLPGTPVPEAKPEVKARKFRCTLCGHVYDEATQPVKWEELPADWVCPICCVGKEMFEEI